MNTKYIDWELVVESALVILLFIAEVIIAIEYIYGGM